MTNPDHCQNPAGNPDLFSCHHKETEPHQNRHRCHNAKFRLTGHPSFFLKRLQVLLIKLCPQKPLLQPFRALGKAEHRPQIKRNCGENGEKNSDRPQPQTNTAQQQKNPSFYHSVFLSSSPCRFPRNKPDLQSALQIPDVIP